MSIWCTGAFFHLFLPPPPSPNHNRHLLPLPLLQNCRIWLPLSKILYPPLESFAHWSQQSICRDRGVGGQGGTCPLNIFKIIELQCRKKKCLVPPPQYWVTNGAPPPNLQVAPQSRIWPSGQPSCQLGFSTLIINYLTVCKTLRWKAPSRELSTETYLFLKNGCWYICNRMFRKQNRKATLSSL